MSDRNFAVQIVTERDEDCNGSAQTLAQVGEKCSATKPRTMDQRQWSKGDCIAMGVVGSDTRSSDIC